MGGRGIEKFVFLFGDVIYVFTKLSLGINIPFHPLSMRYQNGEISWMFLTEIKMFSNHFS